MIANDWRIRREIIEIGKLLYERGLSAATDGNISFRIAEDRILITASGTCLGELEPTDIIYADLSGNKLSGDGNVSSETPMHLAIYNCRADVKAVVHAHPPIATGFTIAGISLAGCVIPEIVMTMGEVPTTRYATPSTAEGASVVKELITNHDALLLDRHGAITIGRTLQEAFYKMEKIEYAAKVTLTARQLGNTRNLTAEELERLRKIAFPHRIDNSSCTGCGTCGD